MFAADATVYSMSSKVYEPVIIFFFVAFGLFHFMYTIFPLGVLYLEHLQLAFDFVVIACSLDTIRPGIV